MGKQLIGDIPFNQPDIGDIEYLYIKECLENKRLSGDGPFTRKCHDWLNELYGSSVLLMHSCTAALEAAAILTNLAPGDEVIMPSFTFVSTANAVVLRGAVPVFIDIRSDTLNMDEKKIIGAITDKTRAIIPVHYAGVGCEMRTILSIANQYGLTVIEDAAQCYGALYDNRPLGSLGRLGCLSFHDTKNVVSGEGGALIINDRNLVERATFIREKGTNRTQFLRREIAKYEWVDIGSSFIPSDILAALLFAQLERADVITKRRQILWQRYHSAFKILEDEGLVKRPDPPPEAMHNGHIYYLLGNNPTFTKTFIMRMKDDGIQVTSHYVPLHSSPGGLRYARAAGQLTVTDRIASTLIRMPMFYGLQDMAVDYIVDRALFHARNI